MKVSSRDLTKDSGGTIYLRTEESEDIWHIFNLIDKGDRVRTDTMRKVVSESSTGSTTSRRLRLKLTVQVEKTDFDPEKNLLRLSGRVMEENPHVRIGAYHTLDLEPNQNFSISKDRWDTIHLDRISLASDPVKMAEVAAVVLVPGLAHVCLVTPYMTITMARIEMNIPRKRSGSSDHSKALTRFYNALYASIIEKIDFNRIKCVLLGSPGFTKDDFFSHLTAEACRRDDRTFIENKAKFVLCHATSGYKRAVEEMLRNPTIASKLSDTRYVKEVQALASFYNVLKSCPDRAYYGIQHVERASEAGAVDNLLVSDSLFRAQDVATRRRYVALIENVRSAGGNSFVFSSMHISGEQLGQLGGVAAILRFPMPEIEDEPFDEDLEDTDDNDAEPNAGLATKVSSVKL